MRCRLSRPALRLLVVATALSVSAACGGPSAKPAAGSSRSPSAGPASEPADRSPSASASASATAAPVDPATVHANELGLVPVLMYHQLSPHPASVYDETRADFTAELETLAREDYVPITAQELVTGEIDIPAGKHPVLLTFDDSTISQLELGPDGQPKPGTAVAILQRVAARHPGFTPTATFFVNNDPFVDGDGRRTLRWLHEHGFDIGDHTVDHANLSQLSTAAATTEIADNLAMIRKAVPGFSPKTMALPYGAYPRVEAVARHGSAHHTTYDFAGVFLVGANPSHSPYHKDFRGAAIPRIRSESRKRVSAADRRYVSSYYLPWLEAHPRDRYTSDGDPDRISFPKSFADVLAKKYAGKANPY